MAFGLLLIILVVTLQPFSKIQSSFSNGTGCSLYMLDFGTIPCNNKEIQFEIEYAKLFCDLNNTDNHLFSHKAQSWINHISQSMQNLIGDLLKRITNKTCTVMNELAMIAHLLCHLNFEHVCELSCDELMEIFWKIRGSLKVKVETNWKDYASYFIKCSQFKLCNYGQILPQMSFKLKFSDSSSSRGKNATD